MTGPRFENTISWNLVLAVVLAVAAGGVSWGMSSAEIAAMRTQIGASEARLIAETAQLRADAAQREGRLRVVENTQGRQDEKLTAILQAVQQIQRQLETGTKR